MTTPSGPRALIRTRPLDQGNYGGILQAYALQQALSDLGVQATTDTSPGTSRDDKPLVPPAIRELIKRTLVKTGLPGTNRASWIELAVRSSRDHDLARFIAENIVTIELYSSSGKPRQEALESFDMFIAGSDQVWRGAYGRVASYLFDFLDDDRPRFSYAASFGTNDGEYSEDLTRVTRRLARQFSAISVREESGVIRAREMWGVEAQHVIDPTMLIDPARYLTHTQTANLTYTDHLATYVLDSHPSTQLTVTTVANLLEEQPRPLLPKLPESYSSYRKNPLRYRRPSIEEWLASIKESRFLVTDSFHGTVFALLFNRPFISVANTSRGTARFESLLGTTGLPGRLVRPGEAFDAKLVHDPIDWDEVNENLAAARSRSLSFLRAAVGATKNVEGMHPSPVEGSAGA